MTTHCSYKPCTPPRYLQWPLSRSWPAGWAWEPLQQITEGSSTLTWHRASGRRGRPARHRIDLSWQHWRHVTGWQHVAAGHNGGALKRNIESSIRGFRSSNTTCQVDKLYWGFSERIVLFFGRASSTCTQASCQTIEHCALQWDSVFIT